MLFWNLRCSATAELCMVMCVGAMYQMVLE